MSFGNTIATDILVATGRCCSLCHKFCGTKIELHHIIPKSEGGDDAFENCMPLCFDCHAEVGSYNSEHPKGRKFTQDELLKHRNAWFAKVARGNGPVVVEGALRRVDLSLFQRIHGVVSPLLPMLRRPQFGGTFSSRSIELLFNLDYRGKDPEWEFLDPDLEALHATLRGEMDKFLGAVAAYTSPLGTGSRSGMGKEIRQRYPRLARRREYVMNGRARRVAGAYEDFVRGCRRKLMVSLDELEETCTIDGKNNQAAEPRLPADA